MSLHEMGRFQFRQCSCSYTRGWKKSAYNLPLTHPWGRRLFDIGFTFGRYGKFGVSNFYGDL
jgi:hypothetical protein